jgi:hypothetical protein
VVQQQGGRRIDQVKNTARVDRETFLALAHKHLGRQVEGVDVFVGVRFASGGIAERFLADVVHWLGQRSRQNLRSAFAAIAPHQGQAVAFIEVEIGIVHRRHPALLDQGDLHTLAVDGQREAVELVVEAKLEGDVFPRVAVVVHMDFIQRVGVHRKIVGAFAVARCDGCGLQLHGVLLVGWCRRLHFQCVPRSVMGSTLQMTLYIQ